VGFVLHSGGGFQLHPFHYGGVGGGQWDGKREEMERKMHYMGSHSLGPPLCCSLLNSPLSTMIKAAHIPLEREGAAAAATSLLRERGVIG